MLLLRALSSAPTYLCFAGPSAEPQERPVICAAPLAAHKGEMGADRGCASVSYQIKSASWALVFPLGSR